MIGGAGPPYTEMSIFLHAGAFDFYFLYAGYGCYCVSHLLHDVFREWAVRSGELDIEVHIAVHDLDFLNESEFDHIVV